MNSKGNASGKKRKSNENHIEQLILRLNKCKPSSNRDEWNRLYQIIRNEKKFHLKGDKIRRQRQMIGKREQTTEKTENALRIVNQNEMQAKQIVGGPESRAEKGPAFAARVYGPAVRLSQKETTKFTSSRKSIIFILDSKSPALHVHSESELLLIKD